MQNTSQMIEMHYVLYKGTLKCSLLTIKNISKQNLLVVVVMTYFHFYLRVKAAKGLYF